MHPIPLRVGFALLAVTVVLATAAAAARSAGQRPRSVPTGTDWPAGLVAALTNAGPVHGSGTHAEGWTYYFTGDIAELNRFLRTLGEERKVALTVALVPEPGLATVGDPGAERELAFTWSMHLARNPAQPQEKQGGPTGPGPEFTVKVGAHLAGGTDPAKLEIPASATATIGGRLAELVDRHNKRRAEAEAVQQDPRPRRPARQSPRPSERRTY